MEFEHTTVLRGGLSHSRKEKARTYVEVTSKNKGRVGLRINFLLDAAGGGSTDVLLIVEPGDFDKLARLMIDCAPDDALHAFGQAIINHTSKGREEEQKKKEEQEKKEDEELDAKIMAKYGEG